MLNKLLKEKNVNLSPKSLNLLEKELNSKKRAYIKSWKILQERIKKEQQSLSTRDCQEVLSKYYKLRYRNILVAQEKKEDFPIKQLLKFESNKDPFYDFAIKAWWKYEAKDRHRKNIYKINLKQIKPNKNTLFKAFLDQKFNHPFLTQIRDFSETWKSITNHVPDYLKDNMSKNEPVPTNMKSFFSKDFDISYKGFSLNLEQLDNMPLGDDYIIILPKKLTHIRLGGIKAKNCVSALRTFHKYKEIESNKDKALLKGSTYMDAHILNIKTKEFVGIFALEELFHIQRDGKPVKSLFVNDCNGTNREMEIKLNQLIFDLYKLENKKRLKDYTGDQTVKNIKYSHSLFENSSFLMPNEILNKYNTYYKK